MRGIPRRGGKLVYWFYTSRNIQQQKTLMFFAVGYHRGEKSLKTHASMHTHTYTCKCTHNKTDVLDDGFSRTYRRTVTHTHTRICADEHLNLSHGLGALRHAGGIFRPLALPLHDRNATPGMLWNTTDAMSPGERPNHSERRCKMRMRHETR